MDRWRPEKWENGWKTFGYCDDCPATPYSVFEDGADAMLAALRVKGESDQENVWPIEPVADDLGQGTWVFIPDDDVQP